MTKAAPKKKRSPAIPVDANGIKSQPKRAVKDAAEISELEQSVLKEMDKFPNVYGVCRNAECATVTMLTIAEKYGRKVTYIDKAAYHQVVGLFCAGKSILRISSKLGLSESAVWNALCIEAAAQARLRSKARENGLVPERQHVASATVKKAAPKKKKKSQHVVESEAQNCAAVERNSMADLFRLAGVKSPERPRGSSDGDATEPSPA